MSKKDIEYIFDEIADKNLDEKLEVREVKIRSCEECKYYDCVHNEGLPTVHFCTFDKKNPIYNIDEYKLYKECPVGHHVVMKKMCIKRYGLIHTKPEDSYYYSDTFGTIKIVDFKDTQFEWDGYNPDVRWTNVAIFYYETEEEKLKMMEFAVELYKRLNLDDEYSPKNCYG